MATSGKLEVDVEVKSDANKFWNAIRDSPTFFPKALPLHYKSIEVLEGDGKAVGSVSIHKYADGSAITFSKERIDEVDEEKKTMSYSVIDGEAISFFKSFKARVGVSDKGEAGSLVMWSCEFEKAKEEDAPITPEHLKEFAITTFKELDGYLLKA